MIFLKAHKLIFLNSVLVVPYSAKYIFYMIKSKSQLTVKYTVRRIYLR